MTQTPDALRTAFEQWASGESVTFPLPLTRHADGTYRSFEVQLAWEAWQAALSREAPTPSPKVAHSKSEYKRLKTMGADVQPPTTPEPIKCNVCGLMYYAHETSEVVRHAKCVDRAALRAAVGRMQGKSFDFDSRDFVLRADVLRLLTGGTDAKPPKPCEHASLKWDALGGRGVCQSCHATVFCSNATKQASGRYDCGRNNLQCGFPACLLTGGTKRSGE